MMTKAHLSAPDGIDVHSTGGLLACGTMERKQLLPLAYWGLDRWPFGGLAGTDQFYPTAGHTEALARIEHLVDTRRRMGVLLGVAGAGKSLVLQVAARKLAREGRAVARIEAFGVTARELLWQIASGLGTAPGEDADAPRLWRQITDRVVENRLQLIDTVLLLDDAGQAGPDVVTQVMRLARVDTTPNARWTMVLAAEPAQAAHWNETLRELVDLRIDLSAWDAEEMVGYVQTALVDAGRFEPLFEEEALAALHELSGGVPRRVARLAELALLAGAAAELETIDAATIDAANDEIAWPAAASAF